MHKNTDRHRHTTRTPHEHHTHTHARTHAHARTHTHTHTLIKINDLFRSTLTVTKDRNTELHSQQLSCEEELTALRHKLSEAECKCKQELQAMRERHRLKFNDSTNKLRSQCKALSKRVVVLETQLSKNSVSKLLCICVYGNVQCTLYRMQ